MDQCLYGDGEFVPKEGPPLDAVVANGVQMACAFHPRRIVEAKSQIALLLRELPDEFFGDLDPVALSEKHPMRLMGGGASFLQACTTRRGAQWGEHWQVDELLCLGLATGLVQFCATRDLWQHMPGGVPYFVVDRTVLDAKATDFTPTERVGHEL